MIAQPQPGYSVSHGDDVAELGRGHIEYPPIFAAAKNSEVEWYYVEQEPPYEDMPVMEAIKVDYEYLQKLNDA